MSERVIATVGDPNAPLSVAAMVTALKRLRMAGVGEHPVFHLDNYQANDVEAALVAGPRNEVLFRGTRVTCTGVGDRGYLHAPEAGVRVDILSSRDADTPMERALSGGRRVTDPRARRLPPEEIARLAEEHRALVRAMRPASEVKLDDVRDILYGIRPDVLARLRNAPPTPAGDGPIQGKACDCGAARGMAEAIDRVLAILSR